MSTVFDALNAHAAKCWRCGATDDYGRKHMSFACEDGLRLHAAESQAYLDGLDRLDADHGRGRISCPTESA